MCVLVRSGKMGAGSVCQFLSFLTLVWGWVGWATCVRRGVFVI
jgi:hypothetical protein